MPSGNSRPAPLRLAGAALVATALLAGCTTSGQDTARRFVTTTGEPVAEAVPRPVVLANGERITHLPDQSYAEGKQHLLAGRYGLAVHVLRKAQTTDPKSIYICNALAIAYGRLGRDDLSLRWFERALILDPHSFSTLNNIGFWALERGQLDMARRYLQRAAEQAPGDARVAANLALLGSVTPSQAAATPSTATQYLPPSSPTPLDIAPSGSRLAP